VLGPRGLMPNPKSGTVTLEVGKAVKDVKAGKVDFKIDKQAIIHASVGKASFTPEKIRDNVAELLNTVTRLKPASAKGEYIRSVTLSTTMSPGVAIDKSTLGGSI
ncbi:MAG: 50S ribosomal protein L1, partial [Bacteroidota bacterium]